MMVSALGAMMSGVGLGVSPIPTLYPVESWQVVHYSAGKVRVYSGRGVESDVGELQWGVGPVAFASNEVVWEAAARAVLPGDVWSMMGYPNNLFVSLEDFWGEPLGSVSGAIAGLRSMIGRGGSRSLYCNFAAHNITKLSVELARSVEVWRGGGDMPGLCENMMKMVEFLQFYADMSTDDLATVVEQGRAIRGVTHRGVAEFRVQPGSSFAGWVVCVSPRGRHAEWVTDMSTSGGVLRHSLVEAAHGVEVFAVRQPSSSARAASVERVSRPVPLYLALLTGGGAPGTMSPCAHGDIS